MNVFAVSEALGDVPEDLIALCFDEPDTAAPVNALPQQKSVTVTDSLPKPVKKPVRISRIASGIAAAACLLFAVGFRFLFHQPGSSDFTVQSSGESMLDEAAVTTETNPQTAPPETQPDESAKTQTAPAKHTDTPAKPTTHTEPVQTAPPAAQTAASVPRQTESAAAVQPAALTTAAVLTQTSGSQTAASGQPTVEQQTKPSSVNATEPETTSGTTATTVTTAAPDDGIERINVPEGAALEWCRDYHTESVMQVILSAAPDTVIRWETDQKGHEAIYAVNHGKPLQICTGEPIRNVFFSDLTGDGVPEVCISSEWNEAFDFGTQRQCYIYVFDMINRVVYQLGERLDIGSDGSDYDPFNPEKAACWYTLYTDHYMLKAEKTTQLMEWDSRLPRSTKGHISITDGKLVFTDDS